MTLKTQDKALLLALICIIAFICVGIFLGINFSNINQDGVKCLDNPLGYAEKRMFEDKKDFYNCECKLRVVDISNPLINMED